MPPSPRKPRKTVLILGGTAEARKLAGALVAAHGDALRVVTSLAGATREPRKPAGETRIGGFGGADGLADYLRAEKVSLLIDATHPFAAQISAHAAAAAEATNVPLLALVRPAWTPARGDKWIDVPDVQAAAREVAARAKTCLLTTGIKDLAAFASISNVRLIARVMEPSDDAAFPGIEPIVGRPPYSLAAETALFRDLGIDTLVSKNAGGGATRAKLDAARDLGLEVIMISRPTMPARDEVASIEDALAAVRDRLGR